MGQVEDALVVGIGMNRRHQAVTDAKILQDDFCHWRQTIGRTGRVGDDLVLVRIVVCFVHTEDDGQVGILRRC